MLCTCKYIRYVSVAFSDILVLRVSENCVLCTDQNIKIASILKIFLEIN